MRKRTSKTFVSLFSGCGGFDIGFSRSGFRCLGAYDVDKNALDHHARFTAAPTHVANLTDPRVCLPAPGQADILLAGPPCQGFSLAGRRELHDPRNQLLLTAGRLVLSLRPKVCLIENVPGVRYGNHRKYWDKLEGLLRNNGYRSEVLTLKMQDLGLAQSRTRIVLVGWMGGAEKRLSLPSQTKVDLRTALRDVSQCANHSPVFLPTDTRSWNIARRIRPGQKLSNVRGGNTAVHTWHIPEVFGRTTEQERRVLEAVLRLRRRLRRRKHGDADPVSAKDLSVHLGRDVRREMANLVAKGYLRGNANGVDLTNTFNGLFRRLQWDGISLAVDTRFGNPRFFLHPDEPRGLTVREAARIQGFPDDFYFQGSLRDSYRMIGNAVPPIVAEQLAHVVAEAFFS